MSDNNTSSGGAGFTSLLLVAFIVLKLTGVIAWSWWWVLSPAWISAGIVLVILGVISVIALMDQRRNRKIVNKQGQMRSKWQQRLDEARAANNQRELDEKMKRSKGDEHRSQNIV